MIFNNIARELNQNERPRYSQNNQMSQSSYFPQKQYVPTNIFQNTPQPTYPKQNYESTLSKMNSKITENIEYLRYKDKMRSSELRSSRVSATSHRSNRSNNSHKSIRNIANPSNIMSSKSNSSSQMRSYLPSEQSKLKTFVPPQQYYRPQDQTSKSSHNYWKNQNQSDGFEKNYTSDEFKYFTRNPVTIDANTYFNEQRQKVGEPERDVNLSHQKSTHSNQSDIFYDFNQEEKSKRKDYTLQSEEPRLTGSREWNASFGGSLKNSKININKQTALAPLPKEFIVRQDTSRPSSAQSLSPLERVQKMPAIKQPSSKNGIIISSVLIALGLIILLLQIMK